MYKGTAMFDIAEYTPECIIVSLQVTCIPVYCFTNSNHLYTLKFIGLSVCVFYDTDTVSTRGKVLCTVGLT